MRTKALLFAVIFAATSAAAGPAQAQTSSEIVDTCLAQGGSAQMCWGIHGLLRTIGGLCRDATMENAPCELVDGVSIDEALVAAHEAGWLAQTLRLQRGLDDHRPLHDETWAHTHNSFNADAYDFEALGGLDRNQIYTVVDQLRLGIRAIEIDIHWAPHVTSGSPNAVQVCHGEPIPLPTGTYHLGCEINNRLLAEHLADIKAWMDANPDEIVLIDLENTLDGVEAAHNEAAAAIEATFGDLVLKPPAPGTACTPLPMDTSRQAIYDAEQRVMFTGKCGPGAWNAWVFERGPRWKEGGLEYGDDFTPERCAAELALTVPNWVRHYGDETGLSAGVGAGGDVTVNDALGMTRCGTNMPGMDNLVPFDKRLEQFAWSWEFNEPSRTADGLCAAHNTDGRFKTRDCTVTTETVKIKRKNKKTKKVRVKRIQVEHFTALPFACFDGTKWGITQKADRWSLGDETCAAEGLGAFEVPWSGFENERLKAARPAGVTDVWLDYHASGGNWIR